MTWSTDWLTPAAPSAADPQRWMPADVGTGAFARPQDDVVAAEQDVADVQPDIDALLQAAYEDGVAEGARIAERLAADQVAGAMRALESALLSWEEGAAQREANMRDNVHGLAVGVARHVIGRELRDDAQGIADLVRLGLSHFPLEEPIRIRINPEDLSVISTATDGAVRIATGRKVEWHADPELKSGDCVVEGERRIVDGRVDRALERIYQALSNG